MYDPKPGEVIVGNCPVCGTEKWEVFGRAPLPCGKCSVRDRDESPIDPEDGM